MPIRSIVLLLALAWLASADRLSEREALASAERLLREKKWHDAIRAFAQTHKAYPGPRVGASYSNPRTDSRGGSRAPTRASLVRGRDDRTAHARLTTSGCRRNHLSFPRFRLFEAPFL